MADDPLIVFDMDGVLVDVTESYRETIVRTVEHFTGVTLTRAADPGIQEPGRLERRLEAVASHYHRAWRGGASFKTVVDYFQDLFHGNGTDGLILRERWLARDGLFDRLAARFDLAIFTGRLQ